MRLLNGSTTEIICYPVEVQGDVYGFIEDAGIFLFITPTVKYVEQFGEVLITGFEVIAVSYGKGIVHKFTIQPEDIGVPSVAEVSYLTRAFSIACDVILEGFTERETRTEQEYNLYRDLTRATITNN